MLPQFSFIHAAGASQPFLLTLVPSLTFAPETVAFNFTCSNTDPAPTILGFNTLLLSSSKTLVPNLLSYTTTTSDDGILHIPGTTGTTNFYVTATNYGANGTIKISANTGSKALPVTLTVCETRILAPKCISGAKPSMSVTMTPGLEMDFAVFAKGTGTIPASFATNRIFVQFADKTGAVRGLASVALQTN